MIDSDSAALTSAPPRLGFLGAGWIGRHRMKAIAESDSARIVALSDANPDTARETQSEVAPDAVIADSIDELLDANIDGLVIATPSAMHAEQSIFALSRGVAVFCQKPLARDGREARRVVDAARRADRLLGVDLSYRHITGVDALRALVGGGELGKVFAADLVFHNAYGPDKPWFYDRKLSGGGCLIDLGVHLVDLALWALDFPSIVNTNAHLFAGGKPLADAPDAIEDFASAQLLTDAGTHISLACSWKLHAGCEAAISATFYGTAGAARLRNTGGSFYDFTVERLHGTNAETIVAPDTGWRWGGRAAVEWATRLRTDRAFDPSAEEFVTTAETLDRIYAAARTPHTTSTMTAAGAR